MGDPESKRKRYCLMCNVFKPDRCHHCSVCNKCNLNMDHHCPWVNNCIGFWNRKFFALLLFYTLCILYFYAFTMLGIFIDSIHWHMKAYYYPINWKEFAFISGCDVIYIFVVCLAGVLTKFAHFHWTLIVKNITTIESIEHKGTNFQSIVRFIGLYVLVRSWSYEELATSFWKKSWYVAISCIWKIWKARGKWS